MKTFFTFVFIVGFISNVLFSQTISLHQSEFEKYSKYFEKHFRSVNSEKQIVELQPKESKFSVFGYLPFWEINEIADDYLRFDILTHIALFAFEANDDGTLTPPYNWPWTDIINEAHGGGVKAIMTVVNFDAPTINKFLSDEELAQTLMENIYSVINEYKLDGVNIDFEAMYNSDEGEPINNFMSGLSDYLKSQNENLEISFAAPAINWNDDWNFDGLAAACDYIFIMGYDFYGSWSDVTGPVAPLTGGTYNVNLQRTIYEDYWGVVQTSPEKLILGVPYYGTYWTCESDEENSDVIEFIDNLKYRTIKNNFFDSQLNWSDEYKTPWLVWEDSTWNQIWFDDDSSLAMKYDLVLDNNLKGAGMWALGYDDGYAELWETLDEKFGDSNSGVELVSDDEVELLLEQNYPNPFGAESSTTVRFGFPNGSRLENGLIVSHITLKLFNSLGEEVAALVKGNKLAGLYEITFSMPPNLPSGVYFYSLNSNGVVLTKKMVYLK